ncbi:MAG: S-layer homology domain-containing protein [Sedimentibacter saalensis]|uniref:S-layer homology domain-containing protein n=1 Tax=Sedimentibacter saalensis TaxID=130788 RepID=UPI003158B847
MALKKLVKRLVIPMVTIILCMGMLQSTAVEAVSFDNMTVAVSVEKVPVNGDYKNEYDGKATVGDTRVEGQPYKEGWIATYNNFLDMRRELESLTGSYVINGKGFGNLYRAVGMSDISYETPAQTQTMRLFNLTTWYRRTVYTKEMQTALRKLAAKTFSDINETDWYAGYIPLSVYMGVINGYEDETFKGNNKVTYAEFAKMYTNSMSEKIDNEYADRLFGEQWFNDYLESLTFGIEYDCMTVAELNSPISRGEVAMIIARDLYTDDLINIYNNLKEYQATDNYWSDLRSVGKDLGMANLDMEVVYRNLQNAKGNSEVVPVQTYASIEALRKNGVLMGNENKECNWNEPITRAEVLKMIIVAIENLGKDVDWVRE